MERTSRLVGIQEGEDLFTYQVFSPDNLDNILLKSIQESRYNHIGIDVANTQIIEWQVERLYGQLAQYGKTHFRWFNASKEQMTKIHKGYDEWQRNSLLPNKT